MTAPLISRIILALLLGYAVLQGWWIIALPLGLAGVWSFRYYGELIVAGIAYDALFGFSSTTSIWPHIGTISAAVILLVVLALKRIMRQ